MGAWRARGMVADLEQKIAEETEAVKNEMRQEHDVMRKETGEAVAAVRQALTDAQFWNRDNLVHKERFVELHRSMEAMSAKMDRGFEGITSRIEKLRMRE
jgi:cell division septum initiation protein DivIVA